MLSAGAERCVACPAQRAEVSFFNMPNTDDELLFDTEFDDPDKGPVFDAELIHDHVTVSVFEFVRPEDKVPLFTMELSNLTTACLDAISNQEPFHDDFDDGPIFDEEPLFDTAKMRSRSLTLSPSPTVSPR
jgi:hypothetical protein